MKVSGFVSGCVLVATAMHHGASALDEARILQDITPSPTHSQEEHDHEEHSPAPTMAEDMTSAPTNVDGTSGSSGIGPAPGGLRSFAGAVTTCAVALIAGVMWAL